MSDSHQYAATQAIQKKLKGRSLSYKEIFTIMDEIAHERLGDILTTYFAAAGFSKGFSADELFYLTKAMVETGQTLSFPGIVADKHSTGGLPGTRTTMIVVPIIAAAGYTIPKTSSRAITTPAGTADVMEIFSPVTFPPKQIQQIVEKTNGCIVWGGKLGIAPADDVMIRVEEPISFESFDKIIVSIMAKKIAVGTNHLILDIPWGKTMKIVHRADALTIVEKFQEIANRFNITLEPYLNHASEPAGDGIGAFLEAVDVLKVLERDEDRPLELEEKSLIIAGKLLDLCYQTDNLQKHGYAEAKRLLDSGKAFEKFCEIIEAQGGKPDISSKTLTSDAYAVTIPHHQSGTISMINTHHLNAVAKILGAPEDRHAGVRLHHKTGSIVTSADSAVTLYSRTKDHLTEAEHTLDIFPIFQYQ